VAEIKIDRPESWPADLLAYLNEHYDRLRGWELPGHGDVSAQEFDRTMYGLREVLERHSLLGWHCTRLTDSEIEEIVTNGMRLPDAEMLVRRIDEVQ
jgi:hypothetical protein